MAELGTPQYRFIRHPSTTPFTVPSQTYLANNPDSKFKYMATGALVFDNSESDNPRVLLLQRCAHDSWPNCWEIPGGACDAEDESILHGVARELWEESGLVASHIGPTIGDAQLFVSTSGRHVGKFVFLVTTVSGEDGKAPEVKLSPEEHQNFVWASEEEVKSKRIGDIKLDFTTSDAYDGVLKALELKRTGGLKFD